MFSSKNRSKILISVILLLAFIVRIYGITKESIWLDESFSIYNAQQPLKVILSLKDTNPPLHTIILSIFIKFFGTGMFWVRLPSLIFGVLSVYLTYLFCKKFLNEKIGLISATLLALSRLNIFYSQEARTYSLLTFLSILSMFYFMSYAKTFYKNHLAYYSISTIILLYSHYFALLILLTQNIFLLILINKKYLKLKYWAFAQSIILFVFLLTFLNLLSQFNLIARQTWRSKYADLTHIVSNLIGGWELIILFLLILLYGFYFIINNRKLKSEKIVVLLLLWTELPILTTMAYSLVISPIFLIRYVIFCSVPLCMLLAFSLDKLNKYIVIMVLTVVIIFSSFYIVNQVKAIDKEPWANVSNYTKSIVNDKDVIIVDPGFYLTAFAYYYTPKCFGDSDIYRCSSHKHIYTIWNNLGEERNYVAYANRIVYVNLDKESYFLKYLKENFEIKSQNEFNVQYSGNINVYLFTSKSG